MTKEEKIRRTSEALHAYLNFRAQHEGVECTLDPEFFEDALRHGVRDCFGITFANGKLTGDEQQPELFRRWVKTKQ
jgi:hypothetical protein